MIKHLYFIRHAETEANLQQCLMGGRMDSPLTEKGTNQAEALRSQIETLPIEVFYVSTNMRAQNTANILNKNKMIAFVTTDEVKEQDFGDMTGVLLKYIPS